MNIPIKSNINSVIIGAGFAGIASALRLRALGHNVTLIERLDQIGGRARTFVKDGYKHDAGPTVITAPFLFRELFELFNENFDEYIELIHLDPYYRFYFSETDEHFDYRSSVKATQIEIARFSEDDAMNLVVNGFCKDVFQKLPLEFAAEANKLLSVTLEGAVG